MPVRYYQDSVFYPYAVEAVLNRIKLYFCNMIYPTEDYATQSSKRFILADVSDDGNAIRRSIDVFKNSQGTFPFTAYNISDDAPLDYRSHLQVSGSYYSELVNAYISFVPMNLDIPMTTYYTTPYDFWRAMSFFAVDEASLTRLDVPLIINGVECYFTIDLAYTTERGQLAWDIEQYFSVGRIYPLIHNITVKCAYIVLANNNNGDKFTGTLVYPVDDIIFYLKRLDDAKNLDQNPTIDTAYSPDTPAVISSIPLSGATGILTTSSIVLTFNNCMNETSVINALDIVPYMDKDMTFDMSSKILTITPRSNMTVSTSYNILINDTAKDGNGLFFETDYNLTFTTGIL